MDYIQYIKFFDALRNGTPLHIDVYDAAAWMSVTALSEYSIKNGNIPVDFPDFTNGKRKTTKHLDI